MKIFSSVDRSVYHLQWPNFVLDDSQSSIAKAALSRHGAVECAHQPGSTPTSRQALASAMQKQQVSPRIGL
jgi:hypothetical protein